MQGENLPNEQELRVIKQQLPSIMSEARGRNSAPAVIKKPSDGELCRICGANYKIIVKHDSNKHCADCRAKLDDGQTALVCISGRFMFMKMRPPEERTEQLTPENKKKLKSLRGEVVRVTVETMDKLVQKQKYEQGSKEDATGIS